MDVLVSHDGELADVCQILRELGASFAERVGAPPVVDLARPWDLVVATPMRVARLACALARPETRALVVAEPGTRAAGRRLHQLGVDWVANRPVHPAALRLLLRHALYRGPERRQSRRVTVGLPVRYRAGWIPRRALLRELSLRGASLVADRHLPAGRRVRLEIDDEGVRIRIDAEVVRSRGVGPPGRIELGLAFDVGPATPVVELRRLIDRHARGPATCAADARLRGERTGPAQAWPWGVPPARAGATATPTPVSSDADGARDPAETSASTAACGETHADGDVGTATPDAIRAEAASAADRRGSERRPYERRVIAVTDGAPRVVIGRDLSFGGMRIESGAPLALGQCVRLALHVRAGEVPLVVVAEVVRADADGTGLRFEPLSDGSREYLARMLDALPVLSAPAASTPDEPRVLAELL